MDRLVIIAIDAYSSEYGEDAIAEGRQRIKEAQEHWKQYRDKHCLFGYYAKAPVHSGSQFPMSTSCKADITKERIEEILTYYLRQ